MVAQGKGENNPAQHVISSPSRVPLRGATRPYPGASVFGARPFSLVAPVAIIENGDALAYPRYRARPAATRGPACGSLAPGPTASPSPPDL